jgi:hypothetical protein
MAMKIALGLLALGMVLLAGCAQITNDLSDCADKCNSLCALAKQSNFSFGGYNHVGLKKISGGVTVSCDCMCG